MVNIDVKNKNSSLIVEVLNENGLPIFGFTKKDCIKLKKIDATKEGVRKGYPLFLCKKSELSQARDFFKFALKNVYLRAC